MERLDFVKANNITDYEFFSANYEALMTVYTICNLFNDFNIKNLNIDKDIVYFELNKGKYIPIIYSSSIYDDKYTVDINITDNIVKIKMMTSG